MRLFTQEVFRQKQLSADFFRFFIAGVLAYIILHFLFFYFQRREEPSALWIALFSFLVLIRHVATQRLLPDFFPGWISADGFELQIFLELATMYLMLPVFYTYLRNLYSLETQDLVEKLFWGFGVLSSVAVALLPLNLHYFLLLPNQLVILVGSVLVIVSFVRTLLKRRIGAGIAMSGFIVFFLTILQDILFAQRIIQSVYLAPYGFLAFLVSHSLLLSRTFAKAMKSTEVLNESLYRFVPREFLGHLEKESVMDVNLGDSNELSMTVLFSDIRDFTSISEEMGAQATFSFLNEYYGRVGPMIRNQGGYIDKYIGDAILALFPGPPQNALQAGKDMLELVTQFNKENQNRLPKLRIGIGIHCGDLMIGTLGEKERLDGTVISDTVNTASRIENKTKEYPSRLLVSEMVLNGLPSEVRLSFEDFGEITLKGKTRRTRLFGLKED